jgi:hypothetical protein
MIRDPSDGSVREKPTKELDRHIGDQAPRSTDAGPLIDTSTSGLPITKAKAEILPPFHDQRLTKDNECRTNSR